MSRNDNLCDFCGEYKDKLIAGNKDATICFACVLVAARFSNKTEKEEIEAMAQQMVDEGCAIDRALSGKDDGRG